MYQLLTQSKDQIQSYTIYGDISGITFDEDNVISGSLSFTNQCSDMSDFGYGGVYIGQMKISFTGINIPRNDWIGKDIGIGFTVNDSTSIPFGIYRVDSATHSDGITAITAYDYMSLFDEPMSVNAIATMTSAYDLLKYACDNCGIILANSKAEIEAMPNGNQPVRLNADSDIENYRDLIHWVAQTLTAFATMNREGELELRTFHKTVDDTLQSAIRFKTSKYGDEIAKYTAFTISDLESGEDVYYKQNLDDGRTMTFGANPFIQGEYASNFTSTILGAFSNIEFTPCEVEIPFGGHYDLGDVLSFPNGSGSSTNKFLVAYYSWTVGGTYKVKSIPASKTGKNKAEKRLTSMNRKNAGDKIQYYILTNLSEIDVEDGNQEKIIDILFQTTKPTIVAFQAEVLCEVETTVDGIDYDDCRIKVTYELDDVELTDYYPMETWQDGKHLLHLIKFLNITDNTSIRTFEVFLEADGGSVHIDIQALNGSLYGQNLVASDDWDGTIKVEEDAPSFELPTLIFGSVTENIEWSTV
jgi:hypothetical protein